ncbi:MAG: hypothetical protein MI740_05810, partial [Halanaerobiales bacterium]|nr:hypothetical protein [Halanaerobiales bacterium]
MYISLNGTDWKLQGWLPYTYRFNSESGLDFKVPHFTEWINAEVPGSVHNDLIKAGMVEDPYYELNALKCEWVENKWWLYRKTFTLSNKYEGKIHKLVFKGVDYKSRFFLNGFKLGKHENMFTSAEFDITDVINYVDENVLEVICEGVPEDYPQMGYTSRSRHQKSRFGYSWDFCTRLVNVGIWQDVGIHVYDYYIMDDIHIMTDVVKGKGLIKVSGSVDKFKNSKALIEFKLLKDNHIVMEEISNIALIGNNSIFSAKFIVENPALWYPNRMGKQELYTLEMKLYANNLLQDEKVYDVGIRRLEYVKNVG